MWRPNVHTPTPNPYVNVILNVIEVRVAQISRGQGVHVRQQDNGVMILSTQNNAIQVGCLSPIATNTIGIESVILIVINLQPSMPGSHRLYATTKLCSSLET